MEPTLADLQAQIDQLSEAVARERDAPGSPEALDQLTELTGRCREILRHWTDMDHRHSEALGVVEARLGEWGAIESRLERESADRLRALEQAIEREWKTIKDIHEAPAQQLRDQANALSQTSMAAANLSLRAFERTEARLAALEADLHQRLTQLSNDVHTALNEMRRDGGRVGPALPGPAPFPLDGVMRIHDEHREGTDEAEAAGGAGVETPKTFDVPPASPPSGDAGRRALPEAASAWTDRLVTLEREVTSERNDLRDTAARTEKVRRENLITAAIVAGAILVAGFVAFRMEQDLSSRLQDASTRVSAAEQRAQTASDAATREVASARADADRQIGEARESARRAELTSTVLAAPDLIRYALEGSDQTGRAAGQALFSRSSGLVVSATHVAATPAASTYQVWLIGASGPVDVGTITPDANGRAAIAIDALPDVPRPVTGVMVTIEPAGSRPATPTGPILLTRGVQ